MLRGPDEVPGDGWSSFPVDAAAIFAEVPGLSLCPGSKLCAYVYRSGDERRGLDVPDLLRMFEQTRHEKLDDDALLLG